MQIEINYEQIYNRLLSINASPQDIFFLEATKQLKEGESWKEKKESPKQFQKIAICGWSDIPLINPFKKTDSDFTRLGNLYSTNVDFYLNNGKQIRAEVQKTLLQTLKDNFLPTNNDEGGYILGQNKTIEATISGKCTNDLFEFSFGSGGAKERSLTTLEEFAKDMFKLQNYLNIFMTSVYQVSAEINKTPIPPEGLVLRLGNT